MVSAPFVPSLLEMLCSHQPLLQCHPRKWFATSSSSFILALSSSFFLSSFLPSFFHLSFIIFHSFFHIAGQWQCIVCGTLNHHRTELSDMNLQSYPELAHKIVEYIEPQVVVSRLTFLLLFPLLCSQDVGCLSRPQGCLQ